jgi:2-isopropylmalate synthase
MISTSRPLGITLTDKSITFPAPSPMLWRKGREAMFDAEHFFDGYKANPAYALACLTAAHEAGARWVVLCDTNGGTLPHEIGEITSARSSPPASPASGWASTPITTPKPPSRAALPPSMAGARQVQGTLNGLGERCGNANLTALIPTLLLKDPYASRFETGVTPEALTTLTAASRQLDDILNRVPLRQAPTWAPRPSRTRRGCTPRPS